MCSGQKKAESKPAKMMEAKNTWEDYKGGTGIYSRQERERHTRGKWGGSIVPSERISRSPIRFSDDIRR